MPKDRGGRSSYRRRKDGGIWWIAGIAVGATALLIVLSNLSAGGAGDIIMPAELKTDQERSADRNVLGKADAPVELVEYSDFLCPHCADVNAAIGPQLKQMAEAGQVRVVHKHMLVIDPVISQDAAEAAECAADQGQYWNFHDLLFANQAKKSLWSRKTLKNYAKELGLNTQAFNQCMDDRKYEEKVLASSKEAYETPGITGTPSFLVNGTLLKLQRSYSEVIEAINAAG